MTQVVLCWGGGLKETGLNSFHCFCSDSAHTDVLSCF